MLIIYENNPLITSEKILLRRLRESDIPQLKELFDQPLSDVNAMQLVKSSVQAWNEGKEYILGIISKEDEKCKGIIEMYGYEEDHLLIGYRIMPKARRQGYASQAVRLLVNHLIHNGIHAVYAAVRQDNIYSAQVLRNSGFEKIEKKDGKLLYAYRKNPAVREEKESGDNMKEIYLAAGCFWGSEKAFSMLDGVIETKTGYANGTIDHPTYEEVCMGDTGFRETVKIVYDPQTVSLETIMKAFFLCIDPTVANRQGNDIGSQYQTGVYYVNKEDEPLLSRIFEEEKKKYPKFHVELEPLISFWPAEAYHQKYLDRNPFGYCHITKKEFKAVKALNKKR